MRKEKGEKRRGEEGRGEEEDEGSIYYREVNESSEDFKGIAINCVSLKRSQTKERMRN